MSTNMSSTRWIKGDGQSAIEGFGTLLRFTSLGSLLHEWVVVFHEIWYCASRQPLC